MEFKRNVKLTNEIMKIAVKHLCIRLFSFFFSVFFEKIKKRGTFFRSICRLIRPTTYITILHAKASLLL